MAMYTTQLKSICESVVLQLNLERKEPAGVRKVTVDDLLNDPAYKYIHKDLILTSNRKVTKHQNMRIL